MAALVHRTDNATVLETSSETMPVKATNPIRHPFETWGNYPPKHEALAFHSIVVKQNNWGERDRRPASVALAFRLRRECDISGFYIAGQGTHANGRQLIVRRTGIQHTQDYGANSCGYAGEDRDEFFVLLWRSSLSESQKACVTNGDVLAWQGC